MGFWRSVFSDGGQASFSRIISAFIVVNVCAWTWIVVRHSKEIPYIALVAMVPFTLQFYGANVVANVGKAAVLKPGQTDQNGKQ